MNLFWPPCRSFYDYKSLHQPERAVAIFCSRQAGVIIIFRLLLWLCLYDCKA